MLEHIEYISILTTDRSILLILAIGEKHLIIFFTFIKLHIIFCGKAYIPSCN